MCSHDFSSQFPMLALICQFPTLAPRSIPNASCYTRFYVSTPALRSIPNAGSPVNSQRQLSGQFPTLALQSIPNTGSPVNSQRRLSGQFPTPALRSIPNAGSPVNSQRRLPGQFPTPAPVNSQRRLPGQFPTPAPRSIPNAGSPVNSQRQLPGQCSVKVHSRLLSFTAINRFIILNSVCNFRVILLIMYNYLQVFTVHA